MAEHRKVKFLRHSPPYMPGDHAVLPEAKAQALKEKGHVELVAPAKAPKLETGRTEFDPAKSPIEEVRAFLAGKAIEIAEDAKEAALRELADAKLAESRQ